jgi:DNA-binding CsgD family transcriptional regulator
MVEDDSTLFRFLHGRQIAWAVAPDTELPHLEWLVAAGATCSPLWSRGNGLAIGGAPAAAADVDALVVDLDIGVEQALRIGAGCAAPCVFLAERLTAPVCMRIDRSHWRVRSKAASRHDFLMVISQAICLPVPDMDRMAAKAARLWDLPRQQARVLAYNLWSYSDQDIADALDVSVHTVQEYQGELRRKTGARTKQSYLARLLELSGAHPPLPATRPTRSRRRPSVD